MNGVHDMGGMQCFGKICREDENTPFHHEWERQVLALSLAMGATGTWNIDQSRSARETLPASFYLSAGYYRIWLSGLEKLLLQHGLITQAELDTGMAQQAASSVKRVLKANTVKSALAAGSPVDKPTETQPCFETGMRVIVRNLHSAAHTRLPSYIRQRTGQIARVHGYHLFADTNARGEEEESQWLYNVRFDNHELWGEGSQSGSVHVDCWESYLELAP